MIGKLHITTGFYKYYTFCIQKDVFGFQSLGEAPGIDPKKCMSKDIAKAINVEKGSEGN